MRNVQLADLNKVTVCAGTMGTVLTSNEHVGMNLLESNAYEAIWKYICAHSKR